MPGRERRALRNYFAEQVNSVKVPPPPRSLVVDSHPRSSGWTRHVLRACAAVCLAAVLAGYQLSFRAPLPLEGLLDRIFLERSYTHVLPTREEFRTYLIRSLERRETR